MPDPKYCKDCAELVRLGDSPKTVRPAPHPGPRCATHHRAAVKARKQQAAERRNVNTYGLEPGQYETLYRYQFGKCAVCRVATGKARRLAVDHDHSDGRVRGLLCKSCNRIIGYARDDPSWFDRAAAYLRCPPAVQLGISAVHVDNRQEAIEMPPDPGRLQPWPFANDTDAGRALNAE